jgi:TonB family protein
MTRRLFLVPFFAVISVSTLRAQPASPTATVSLPQAVYSPRPIYRPEWAKQGLTGKGVVLVTIDTKTGKVSGVRMLQSTGNKTLDGAALETYSQWRFKPGSVPQVKMPIEFTNRPQPQTSKPIARERRGLYLLLGFLGLTAGVMAVRLRRRPRS